MFCPPPIDTLMSTAFSSLLHEFHHQRDQACCLAKHVADYCQYPKRFAHAFGILDAKRQDHVRFGRTLEHSLTFLVETSFYGVMLTEDGHESWDWRIRVHQLRLSSLPNIRSLSFDGNVVEFDDAFK